MSLPSTYTKLDYIESHGTEYFDTGFVPNGNTRVTVDFEGAAVPSVVALFGARTGMTENVFAMWLEGNQALPQYGNVVYDTKPITTTNTVRHTYDLNKGVATVDGSSVSFTNLTFSAGQSLTLLALNSNGTVDGRRPSGKLYGAKVYNNNTLVRDFIPAMNASGVIGLWDDVNSTFYTNAGTGTLTTGKKHKTRIDGTGYEVKGGRVLIGGTGYSIKKGRTLIGGTGYDISFGTPVGEQEVGESVYMNMNGVSTEFIVVQQGKPDADTYDSTCIGTWVLAKDIYSEHSNSSQYWSAYWHETGIQSYLNGLLNLFDDWVQDIIKTVNFPNGRYAADDTAHAYKITVPHPDEIEEYPEGLLTQLDYFKDNVASKRIANYNGEAKRYYVRQTNKSSGNNILYRWFVCSKLGEIETNLIGNSVPGADNTPGIRPLLVLPQDTLIDNDFCLMQS